MTRADDHRRLVIDQFDERVQQCGVGGNLDEGVSPGFLAGHYRLVETNCTAEAFIPVL